jgi:hypothetical protein
MGRPHPSRVDTDQSPVAVRPFVEDSVNAFAAFSCGDEDLDDFIRFDALRLQSLNVARSYVAWYDAYARGYVALMADAVVLRPNERKEVPDGSDARLCSRITVVPALKTAGSPTVKTCGPGMAGSVRPLSSSRISRGVPPANVDAYPDAFPFYAKLALMPERCRAHVCEHGGRHFPAAHGLGPVADLHVPDPKVCRRVRRITSRSGRNVSCGAARILLVAPAATVVHE